MINIRPHHLLCIQNYIGYGYSEEFTAHMDEICEELKGDPKIVIHKGCDDVCTACPNNSINQHNSNGAEDPKSADGTEGACTSLDKVDRMDGMVLDISGLGYGDVISWNEATALVRERIFGAGRFNEICRDCQWFETCSREESRRRGVEVF